MHVISAVEFSEISQPLKTTKPFSMSCRNPDVVGKISTPKSSQILTGMFLLSASLDKQIKIHRCTSQVTR